MAQWIASWIFVPEVRGSTSLQAARNTPWQGATPLRATRNTTWQGATPLRATRNILGKVLIPHCYVIDAV